MIILSNNPVSSFLKTRNIAFYLTLFLTSVFSTFKLYKSRQYSTRLFEVAFLGAVFITEYKSILDRNLSTFVSVLMLILFLFYSFLSVNSFMIKKKGVDKVESIEQIIISTLSTSKETFSFFC